MPREKALAKLKRFLEGRLQSKPGAMPGYSSSETNPMSDNQRQSADQGSTAMQAGRDIVVTNGLSYSDVKEVALDVFRSNFFQLAGIARDTATQRAEQITEAFLRRLEAEHPQGFSQANEPGFQHALYTVQREHARTGDPQLGDLLVDLLVDRSKHEQRDILQIVLDESLATAPKLTEGQLAALSLTFLFKYTQNYGVGDHASLGEYLDKHAKPFVANVSRNAAAFQHLEFTGCGSVGLGQVTLETILGTVYQGQFLKGFDESDISERQVSVGLDTRLFMKCLNDPAKIQVRANSHELLDKAMEQIAVPADDRPRIKGLFDHNKMSDEELRGMTIEIRPYMAELFDAWANSPLKQLTLTSVGIAIGHANVKRLVGEFTDLSTWIN